MTHVATRKPAGGGGGWRPGRWPAGWTYRPGRRDALRAWGWAACTVCTGPRAGTTAAPAPRSLRGAFGPAHRRGPRKAAAFLPGHPPPPRSLHESPPPAPSLGRRASGQAGSAGGAERLRHRCGTRNRRVACNCRTHSCRVACNYAFNDRNCMHAIPIDWRSRLSAGGWSMCRWTRVTEATPPPLYPVAGLTINNFVQPKKLGEPPRKNRTGKSSRMKLS